MTWTTAILWSLIRSVVVASCAVGPARLVTRWINSQRSIRLRRVGIVLAVIPLFVPELLAGFHYRLTATQLSLGAPAWMSGALTELLYGLLQLARGIAVGVVALLLLPRSGVTRESLHSWMLLRSTMPWRDWRRGWWRLQLAGPWYSVLIVWSLIALVVFQEFETAALMQIDRWPVTWTVWLFDAHAARQPLSDSLRMIVAPIACELLLLIPLLMSVAISQGLVRTQHIESATDSSDSRRSSSRIAMLALLPGLVLTVIWPLCVNLIPAMTGVLDLIRGPLLSQAVEQILTSTGFAAASAVLAMSVAATLCDAATSPLIRSRRAGTIFSSSVNGGEGTWARFVVCALLLCGLAGSLIVSLTLLGLFQTAWLRALYDTWLPLLLGQSLTVFPRALAVVLLLRIMHDGEAVHSARLLHDAESPAVRRLGWSLVWRLTTSRWLLGGLVIVHWCFWDVTVASILRPVQLEPVVTRLYNEMHYGRTEALLSLSLLAATTPLLVAAAAMAVSRAFSTSRCRSRRAFGILK